MLPHPRDFLRCCPRVSMFPPSLRATAQDLPATTWKALSHRGHPGSISREEEKHTRICLSNARQSQGPEVWQLV